MGQQQQQIVEVQQNLNPGLSQQTHQQVNHIQPEANVLHPQQQQVIMHYQEQPQHTQNQLIIDPNDPQLQQQITGGDMSGSGIVQQAQQQQQQHQQVIVQHNLGTQQQQPQQQQHVIQQQPQHIVLPHGQSVLMRQHTQQHPQQQQQQPIQGQPQYRTIIQNMTPNSAPALRANIVQQPARVILNHNIRPQRPRLIVQTQTQANSIGVRSGGQRYNRPVRPVLNTAPTSTAVLNNQPHLVRTVPQAAVRPLVRNNQPGVRPPGNSSRLVRPPPPRSIALSKLTAPPLQRIGNQGPRMIAPAQSSSNAVKQNDQHATTSATMVTSNGQQMAGGTILVRRPSNLMVNASAGGTSNSSTSSGEEYVAMDDLEESIQAAKIEKHPTPNVIHHLGSNQQMAQQQQPQQQTQQPQQQRLIQQVAPTQPQMHQVKFTRHKFILI